MKAKSEVDALKGRKKAYKSLLKKEIDPTRQKILKEWIESTEFKIEQHRYAKRKLKKR